MQLPAAAREVALKYPAVSERDDRWRCYRSTKNPNWHFTIHSYDGPDDAGAVTVTLVHGRDSSSPGVGTFGQDPAQLIACDCGHWEWPTAAQRDAMHKRMRQLQRRLKKN
jgi:hypothetical protein